MKPVASPHMPGVAGSSPASSTSYPASSPENLGAAGRLLGSSGGRRSRLQARASRENGQLGGRSITLGTFIWTQYWPKAQVALSEGWRSRSEQVLRELDAELGQLELGRMESVDLDGWWSRLVGRSRSGRSANIRLIRLRHILKLAVRRRYRLDNPTDDMLRARESRGRVRYLSDEQRKNLLDNANIQLRLCILLARATAARRRSVFELTWGDIDFERGFVVLRKTKNGDDHTVPLTQQLRQVLLKLQADLGKPDSDIVSEKGVHFSDSSRVVTGYSDPHSISQAFRRLAARLGMADLRFHDLRHDAISSLAMAGANDAVLQEVGGWRDPRMVARYRHLRSETVRQAMDGVL